MTKHTFKPGEKEQVAAVLGIEPQMLPDTLELENDLDDDEDEDESETEILDEDEEEDDEDDSELDEDIEPEEDDEDDEEDDEAEEQELGIRVQAATDDWLANHKDTISLADFLKTKGF
jgi:hypothetical protein